MNKRVQRFVTVLLIIGVSILLDQLTKQIAYNQLRGNAPISFLNDFFVFTYVENEGAFLSMGSSLPHALRILLLTVLPAILLIGMMVYIFKNRTMMNLERWAIALIAGGGIGNIIDRLAYGKVIDFMNMGLGDLRTGIFNVADLYIVFGIGLFLIAYLKQRKRDKLAAATAEAEAEAEANAGAKARAEAEAEAKAREASAEIPPESGNETKEAPVNEEDAPPIP